MKLDFKKPKYLLPLIFLPFLCLFFYVYRSSIGEKKPESKQTTGLNNTVGDVSAEVNKEQLSDKLDAFRNTYKETDGNSAVNVIPVDPKNNPASTDNKTLDSVSRAFRKRYKQPKPEDRYMEAALNNASAEISENKATPEKETQPMDLFRQQMAYVDSVNKANDPELKAQRLKREKLSDAKSQEAGEPRLNVRKLHGLSADFNTVRPPEHNNFIMAVIDEDITGYAGSRLRLKLMEDVEVGDITVAKGSFIYALISGFTAQRVMLEIKTILYNDQILPVKLEVYDLDGLPGLYVPASEFRDLTKDLGSNTMQGVTIDGSSTGSQFVMSAVGKMFESTSSAIADAIKRDKARIKYNSYLYLIDPELLQKKQ